MPSVPQRFGICISPQSRRNLAAISPPSRPNHPAQARLSSLASRPPPRAIPHIKQSKILRNHVTARARRWLPPRMTISANVSANISANKQSKISRSRVTARARRWLPPTPNDHLGEYLGEYLGGYLGGISTASRLALGCISAVSRLNLAIPPVYGRGPPLTAISPTLTHTHTHTHRSCHCLPR